MDEHNTRKRPRSNSPAPTANSSASHNKNPRGIPSGRELASALREKSSRRNEALNILMRVSGAPELSYALDGEDVVNALADLIFETLGWTKERPAQSLYAPSLSGPTAWTQHVTPEAEEWASFCTQKLEKYKLLGSDAAKCLEAVLLILRNLSFVAANHRLMAHSPDILTVLVGALYETTAADIGMSEEKAVNVSITSALATHAVQALVNLGPYLDVTGQKLLSDKLFLVAEGASEETPLVPNPSSYGLVADGKFGFGSIWLAKRLDTKEDIVSGVPDDMVLELTRSYLLSVWAIFPALTKIIGDSTAPRMVVMMAVELLQEFVNHARAGGTLIETPLDPTKPPAFPDARSVMIHIPDVILQRLVELLYMPRLNQDSLDYVDPRICIVTRVNTLRLLLGYDATIDNDLRDRTLDVLVPLLELDSPRLAERLSRRGDFEATATATNNEQATSRRRITSKTRMQNRLFDAIFPILTSKAGRIEAPTLAGQLLKELSKTEMNVLAWAYLRERLVALGSQDAKIAHLAMNFLHQPGIS